jgi:hypothetical protein
MRIALLVALVVAVGFAMNAQPTARPLYIEYGYPGIPDTDVALKSVYGDTRYRVYADDRYTSVENAPLMPGEAAKGLRSGFIQDRRSGEVYLCVEAGQERFRKRANTEETELFELLTARMYQGEMSLIGTNKIQRIMDRDCLQYWLIPKGSTDTMVVYLNNRLLPSSAVRNFPMAVYQGGEFHGVVLGRDDRTDDGRVIPFRALAIDVDQPQDVAAALAGYRTVSEAEGNTILQRWLQSGMQTDKN